METSRLVSTADEDPYSLVPRIASNISDNENCTPDCFGERVVHELWCSKQSRWLRHWRRRWLVLTPTRLLSFESERGYLLDNDPTEQLDLRDVSHASLLDSTELDEAGVPPEVRPAAIVQLKLSDRAVLVDAAPDATTQVEKGLIGSELVTFVVNAFCAARTNLNEYTLPGCMHAFEPRGLVALRDRYTMGQEIGRGAFGVVCRGRCLQSGRLVAIKHVSLLLARERVRAEVEIMREVRHPHVVRLLNYIEGGRGSGYLVMELLPGGDLYTQVVQRFHGGGHGAGCGGQTPEGYSEGDVREIVRMALSGISAIHDHQVVHRDLKPENVLLLDRRGGLFDLRIADFGTACRLGHKGNVAPERVGTRGYMAPEVLSALPYGLAADVWSLGVMVFTLLCGRPPFDRQDDETKEEDNVRSGRWSFADPNWHSVSEEAKDVVRQFLSNAPHNRPKAHEALALPWVRPATSPNLDAASSAKQPARGPSRGRAGFSRVASLPGSVSLLELAKLPHKYAAPAINVEQSDGVPPCPSSAPPIAPRSRGRSLGNVLAAELGEVGATPSTVEAVATPPRAVNEGKR